MRPLPVLYTDAKFLEVVPPHEEQVFPFLNVHPFNDVSSNGGEEVFRGAHPICRTYIDSKTVHTV